ncbi:uncharacterized protein BO97DRAFT_403218 [Aspergillus homomorphus CBS 101889]|uniref:Uncharacterized protein n=1 Tax=Aspergillus homomorphus (strain CBS 101889) TaxID=1450537 RepID=A0A395I7E7_ASPHC|nr:hypothetical protein BO97DRAFT_403218 [Aspergillus homomorphus CBS 101889]RAL16051.1 hypothetical protein BO97DRAFT_403218 [Aspergillus homomorphus CBS 101889]
MSLSICVLWCFFFSFPLFYELPILNFLVDNLNNFRGTMESGERRGPRRRED